MPFYFFKRKSHSETYQKYMIREPEEVKHLILSYLHEKENSFGLAIDLGCGTGASTRTLVPYFQTVVGVDISRTQIEEAARNGSFPNLSYILAPAEHLPFGDGSVDLVTASVAAHWFIKDKFLNEVDRVLKHGGCLALYAFDPFNELHYEGCSEVLTAILKEALRFLVRNFAAGIVDVMESEYKEIFEAAPFTDKKRVTNIWLKHPVSVTKLMGFIESIYMFQNFYSSDPEGASHFLERLQDRILEILGTACLDKELELWANYYCVLACKSSS